VGTRIYCCSHNCSEKHRSPIESKSKGGSSSGGWGLGGRDPLLLRLASQLFFRLELFFRRGRGQRGEKFETQSSRGKKGPGVPGRLPTFNFQQVDERTFLRPIMNQHHIRMRTFVLLQHDVSKCVSHAERSRCIHFSLDLSHLNQLCSQERLSHMRTRMKRVNFSYHERITSVHIYWWCLSHKH
jgi:hypothetical protein